ncbi:MAG: hypothetical protein RSB41_01390 [Bacilli bacterium]
MFEDKPLGSNMPKPDFNKKPLGENKPLSTPKILNEEKRFKSINGENYSNMEDAIIANKNEYSNMKNVNKKSIFSIFKRNK